VCVLVTQNLSKTLDGSHDAISLAAIPAGLVFGGIERDVDEMPGFRLGTSRSNSVGPRRDLVQMLGMAVVQREQLRNLGFGSVSEPGFSNFGDNGVSFRPPRLCVSTAQNGACEYGSNGNFQARHKTLPQGCEDGRLDTNYIERFCPSVKWFTLWLLTDWSPLSGPGGMLIVL